MRRVLCRFDLAKSAQIFQVTNPVAFTQMPTYSENFEKMLEVMLQLGESVNRN